ncbi:MAG: hypothetical protein H0V35_11945 [Nitrospira sp.]|nr:hypothetical protein [Nitrospira sp.]
MMHGNWKTPLKLLLSRSRLLPAARTIRYRLRWLADRKFRQQEFLLDQEFRRFAREHAAAFRHPPSAELGEGKRVLIVSSGSLGLLVEIALVKAFQLAGYRPLVLTDYDRWMENYYREVGVRDILHWDEYACPLSHQETARILADVSSFEDFINLHYGSARVGKYAASTALRHLRVGRLNLADPAIRDALLPFLHRAMTYTQAAHEIVKTLRPQLVLSVDPGYSPRGELFDVCLAAGIDTITWNAAHKNNQLMLKRYSQANRDVHPASLSSKTWNALAAGSWTEPDRKRLRSEVVGSYLSGEWYSEVGTQFHTTLQEAEETRRTLNLDDRKKTAVIFSHIFWDGTFFYGTDLFGSYEEWFIETMKAACANPHVNWVVKVHPANIVKNVRDGVESEPSELTAIRSLGGDLPPHVRIIQPDSRMSTLSLYAVMDYCVTVRGTVGIEAASFGIPVLTAGTGRYDRLGFTIDSDSKAQYLDRLTRIQEVPPLSAEQRDLAERFAHGVFVLRPFSLRTVTLEYQRDAKASLHTRVCLPQGQDLRSAMDLRSLADWIHSGTEDFLAPRT